jgi:hypothetical protein
MRKLRRNGRGVARYDGWWIWILGSALTVFGLVGAAGSLLNWPGFQGFVTIDWGIPAVFGVVLIVVGALVDKPRVEKYHSSG